MGEKEERAGKVEEFLKKHRPLSPQDVYETIKEAEEARQKYTKDIANVENNLLNFLKREDPLVDPGTGKVIAWIRQLPYVELTKLRPEGLEEIRNLSDEELVKKIEETAEADFIFKLMERLISRPEYSAKKWKEIATLDFIRLFDARITELFSRLTEQMDFF